VADYDSEGGQIPSRIVRLSTELFAQIEHLVYLALGILLSVSAAIALAGAVVTLWQGLGDWTGSSAILTIVDRLLFVLLIVEVLHTIRASIRTGGLSPEPFLIVGLIASIRRVLVITLQTSQATKPGERSPDAAEIVRESMIELTVLGGLIFVLVVSLYLLSRRPEKSTA
jgi:uncharacterized membrane protein (DUF373 family)